VFRDGALLHRSQRQQKRFNCPLQLNGRGSGDSITQADVGEIAVRHGDVLVVGTDGLFDNVFDADLERLVRMGTALGFSPKNMADSRASPTRYP
jgi:protein phosphatase PTC7